MSLFIFVLLAFGFVIAVCYIFIGKTEREEESFKLYCSENGLVWIWDIYESLDYPNLWDIDKISSGDATLWTLKSDNIKIYNETLAPIEIKALEHLRYGGHLDWQNDFFVNGKKTDSLLDERYVQSFNKKICDIIPKIYKRQCKEENQQIATIIT